MGWFTEDELRRVAGDASFRRGRSYVESVAEVRQAASGVRAVVRGTSAYEVWLGNEAGSLVGECDCPFGAAGNFCKHCVAVGLTMLAGSSPDRVGVPQVAVLRQRLVSELRVRGYADDDYADRANGVLDTVRSLVTAGHSAEARPLARETVELIMAALSTVDDSVGSVYRRALSLYARACAASRPNPGRLAEWLYRQWVDGPGWPVVELGWFVTALGDAGLAVYRELVRDMPADVAVSRAMREQLATVDGDVDALVALLSADLPAVRAYQRIVAALSDAGRAAEAIRWAERGAETGRVELAELLVRSYVDGGRPGDAVEFRKAELRRAPTRVVYGRLRLTAGEVGEWPGLRDWALAVLAADCTELVGALLDDGDVEGAWRAAQNECGDGVRLEVAREWGEVAPSDVLGAYRELVAGTLARGGRESYRQAGVLLRELAGFSTRCGAEAEFRGFVASIRERNRRRPALLDELLRAGL